MTSPPPLADPSRQAGARNDASALAPVGTFLGIACITTGLRIYWRLWPVRRIGADDFTLLAALVRSPGTIFWGAKPFFD
jgi:hypothetical protein